MIVFGQKLLYLGRNGCIRDKVVVFRKKWLDSVKVVVFGQKLFNSGKSGCNRVKQVVFAKVVVFGQRKFFSGKVVVFEQRWLYSSKVVVFWQKWYYSDKSCCIRAKVVVFVQTGCI